MEFDLDKALLAAEILGFFGGGGFFAWAATKLTQIINRPEFEPIEGALEISGHVSHVIALAVGEATEAAADDVIDPEESKAFIEIASKIARHAKQKAIG